MFSRIRYSTLESSVAVHSDVLCAAQKSRRLEYIRDVLSLIKRPATPNGSNFTAPIDAPYIHAFVEPYTALWADDSITNASVAQIEGAILRNDSTKSERHMEELVAKILGFLPVPRIHYLYLDEFAKNLLVFIEI